jgi:hypothetical protein
MGMAYDSLSEPKKLPGFLFNPLFFFGLIKFARDFAS